MKKKGFNEGRVEFAGLISPTWIKTNVFPKLNPKKNQENMVYGSCRS
jgi:hypothetical protein